MSKKIQYIDLILVVCVLTGIASLTGAAVKSGRNSGQGAVIIQHSTVNAEVDMTEFRFVRQERPKVVPYRDDSEKQRRRTHEVYMSQDGLVRGRVSLIVEDDVSLLPVDNVEVTIVQQGATKAQIKPGPGAIFQVAGLEPGVYGLIAAGPGAFAAFEFRVLPFDVNNRLGDGGVLKIELCGIPPKDFPVLQELVRSYLGAAEDWSSLDRASMDYGGDYKDTHRIPANTMEGAEEDNSVAFRVVELDDDGQLNGYLEHVHPITGDPVPASNVRIFLIRNNSVIGSGVTDEDGVFSIAGQTPGSLSFVAVGAESEEVETFWTDWEQGHVVGGFGALGLLAVKPEAEEVSGLENDSPFRLASKRQEDGLQEFHIDLIDPVDYGAVVDAINSLDGSDAIATTSGTPGTSGPSGAPSSSGGNTFTELTLLGAGITGLVIATASTDPSPDGD